MILSELILAGWFAWIGASALVRLGAASPLDAMTGRRKLILAMRLRSSLQIHIGWQGPSTMVSVANTCRPQFARAADSRWRAGGR